MKRRMKRKSTHTFKRVMPHDPESAVRIKAVVRQAKKPVTIEVTEENILEAMRRDGYADTQNCGGGVCVTRHRSLFPHTVSGMVDWWRNRVYVHEIRTRHQKEDTCVIYAHYDQVDDLFDTDLTRLLKRVRKKGAIRVTLLPVKRGKHSKTGKPTKPSGVTRRSGKERGPIGGDLRVMEHFRSRGLTIPTTA